MTTRTPISMRRTARGLSIVELMVGVAIGLIGVVAIFQAVTVWTKHTQTTSSGSDAQIAGTLALFNLERDLKQAGHGFGAAANTIMGCVIQSALPPAPAINMRPVEIFPGALPGDPDTVNVLHGNSAIFSEVGDFLDSTPTTKRLARRGGFRTGEVALLAGPVPIGGPLTCAFVGITDDTDANGWIAHDAGVAFPASLNLPAAPAFVSGRIYNLGAGPSYNVWSVVNSQTLMRVDQLNPAPVQVPVADGIVNMKAQYGYDADGDGQIAVGEWVAVLPAPTDWTRVLAVRVAVLVRGRQFERSGDSGGNVAAAVTPTALAPTYFNNLPFRMRNVDGTVDAFGDADVNPNNWRYYRYRVYERVIPLRNMLWGVYG